MFTLLNRTKSNTDSGCLLSVLLPLVAKDDIDFRQREGVSFVLIITSSVFTVFVTIIILLRYHPR